MSTNEQTPAVPNQPDMVLAIPQKDIGVTYLLWFFLGVFGGHHFYLGKPGRGVLYLLTFGCLGIGVLVDLFTLPSQVRTVNAQLRAGVR